MSEPTRPVAPTPDSDATRPAPPPAESAANTGSLSPDRTATETRFLPCATNSTDAFSARLLDIAGVGPVTPPAGRADVPPGYLVEGEIARGSMGVVYRVWQVGLNRLVALKMLLAGDQASPM